MNDRAAEQALVRLVEQYRARDCRELQKQAEEKARRLVLEAFTDARIRLHNAVLAERKRVESRIRGLEADLRTRRRAHRQASMHEVLRLGWERLHEALMLAWQDSRRRQDWIAQAVRLAGEHLPTQVWQVHHPSDWTGRDSRVLLESYASLNSSDVDLIAEPEMAAGLIVSSAGTALDMSLAGLLADRAGLEARLLALLQGGEDA